MAKFEKTLIGDFDQLIKKIEDGILKGSKSATLKDSSDYFIGDVRCYFLSCVEVHSRFQRKSRF